MAEYIVNMTTTIQDVLDARKNYEQMLEDVGQEGIANALKPIFDRFPQIQGAHWKQYTPYFNDGDPCTFSSGHDYFDVLVEGADPEGAYCEHSYYENEELHEQGIKKAWLSFGDEAVGKDDYEEAKALSSEFIGIPDDLMLAVFGDHQAITIMRDGTVDTEDYEHD